jgi:hypothetical protein
MIKPRPALFKWRHFEPEIIVCAVHWYLRFSLSYRDVEELLMERGLPADHTTIWRWVQRYAPELNKRCRRELKPTNGSWRVDESTLARVGTGGASIVPSIPAAPRSTSGFPLTETPSQPSGSFRKPCRLLVIPGRGSSLSMAIRLTRRWWRS